MPTKLGDLSYGSTLRRFLLTVNCFDRSDNIITQLFAKGPFINYVITCIGCQKMLLTFSQICFEY